jgi:hypothetical protein
MVVEVDGLRIANRGGAKDAAITATYNLAIDRQLDDSVPILYSQIERMRHMTLGSGTRNADCIVEQKYPVTEQDLEYSVQTGRWLYPVMGKCVTTGTANGTDTIASGEGTATLTLTTGGLTIDAAIGDFIEFTSGSLSGNKYHITDNDTGTITLDKTVPSGANSAGITFYTAPFTHTITEQDVVSSMKTVALHQELENDVGAESIREDMLGIIVNTHVHTAEMDGFARQTVGLLGAKSVTGSELTRPATLDSCSNIKWGGEAATNTLTYNSVEQTSEVDRVEIEIINNAELKHITGDAYANATKWGERDYTVTLHMFPTVDTLKTLRNLAIDTYVTALAYTYKVQTTATDYIQYTFDDTYVDDFPLEVPDKDALEFGVDVVLKNNAGGTCAIEVKDSLGLIYYEGST